MTNFVQFTGSADFLNAEVGNRRFFVIAPKKSTAPRIQVQMPAPNPLQLLISDDRLASSSESIGQYRSVISAKLKEIYDTGLQTGPHTPGRITAPVTAGGRAFGLIPEGKGWADDLINWSTREFKNPADALRLAAGWNALLQEGK